MHAKIPVIWGTDAVHGNNNVYGATLFPHNIGLGAARDPSWSSSIGAGDRQADPRHRHRLGVRAHPGRGARRPLGPHLRELLGRSRIARARATRGAYVKGLQGTLRADDANVIATAKHFIGDGGTDKGRTRASTRLDQGRA